MVTRVRNSLYSGGEIYDRLRVYIYSMAVQKALKPRIIGSIFCAIRDDVLNIIIENDGKKFEYSIDGITEKIRTGYPVDSVVRYCYDMYKVFVLSNYFY